MDSLQKLKSMSQLPKKRKEDDKIVLLGKAKLATIEVIISKVYIIHMYISHDEFVSLNNGLREYIT